MRQLVCAYVHSLSFHSTRSAGTLNLAHVPKSTDPGWVAQQGLSMLAVLKAELGSLNKIKRVIKLVGFVNSTPDFEMQPKGELSIFYDLLECVCFCSPSPSSLPSYAWRCLVTATISDQRHQRAVQGHLRRGGRRRCAERRGRWFSPARRADRGGGHLRASPLSVLVCYKQP